MRAEILEFFNKHASSNPISNKSFSPNRYNNYYYLNCEVSNYVHRHPYLVPH